MNYFLSVTRRCHYVSKLLDAPVERVFQYKKEGGIPEGNEFRPNLWAYFG
jgi:hypothetical protein